MSGMGEPVLYSLFIYRPSVAAAVGFTILYAISAAFHIWQCFRYRVFKLIGLQALCGVLFTLGYAFRIYGANDNYIYIKNGGASASVLISFILSQVFIYVCPPLLELSNYHILGRIFAYTPHLTRPIRAHLIQRCFGALIAIVELLNALGVALSSNPTSQPATQALGAHFSIAAIAIQIGVVLTFYGVTVWFHLRLGQATREVEIANGPGGARGSKYAKIGTMLWVLYASMFLILVRCIYRLVEHLGPTQRNIASLAAMWGLSPLFRNEVFFLVFESTLMLVNSMLWNVWSPGRFLPSEGNVYLWRDGVEVVGKRDPDERAAWKKGLHVLTFGLLFGKQRRSNEVVEEERELVEYRQLGS